MSETQCPCGGVCPCHEKARIREKRRKPRSSKAAVQLLRARRSGWICERCGVPIRRKDGRDRNSPWVHATSPTCGRSPKPVKRPQIDA